MDANGFVIEEVSIRTSSYLYLCEHCQKQIKLEDAHAVKHDGYRFRHYCFGCLVTPPAQEVK